MQITINQYTREQAIARYNRVIAWEHAATRRLLTELESRAEMPGLTPHLLHNWSIGDNPVYPHLGPISRWYRYQEAQISATYHRLLAHFSRGF